MIEEEEESVRVQGRVPAKKQGSLLLICQGSGNIVFVEGDTSILQLRHSQVIQQNLFTLGFTLRSLFAAHRMHPQGLMDNFHKDVIEMRMELLSRQHLLDPRNPSQKWSSIKKRLIKVLKMSCSLMQVAFDNGPIRHRKSTVGWKQKVGMGREMGMEQLVLVEVEVEERGIVRANQQDYNYTRDLLLEQLQPQQID